MTDVDRAVICDLLLGADPMEVETDDFPNTLHRDIHRAMLQHGPGYDMVSLSPLLSPHASVELSTCTEFAGTAANFKHHVTALKRQRQMSDLKRASLVLTGQLDAGETPEAVLPLIERMREQAITKAVRGPRHISETLMQYMLAGPDNPVPWGLRAMEPLRVVASELCIPAARPRHGKTALLCTIALAAARKGWQVLFFSLEMPARQIHARLVSAVSDVSMDRTLRKDDADVPAIKAAVEELWKMALWVEDDPEGGSHTLESIAALTSLFTEMNQDRPTVVLIDYLQRIPTKARYEKRYELLGHVCRGLKDMAKRCRVPVICAAQLGRGVEQHGKKYRPQLSDLRESGNIEMDADEVVLMNPENEYLTRFNVSKYRQGREFVTEVVFDGAHCRFEDVPEGWE